MLGKSKLRLFAVLVGAIAAFSIVGFAASFTINDGTKMVNAEGETLVVSCDPALTVFKHDKWLNPGADGNPGAGGFFVKLIQVRDIDPVCEHMKFAIVVTGKNGQLIANSNWIDWVSGHINWTPPTNIPVQDVYDIHIAIASDAQDPLP